MRLKPTAMVASRVGFCVLSLESGMRITFKLKARETGLARVCAGPRGYEAKVDGKNVGTVGWHWIAGYGGDRGFHFAVNAFGVHYNSSASGESFASMDDARDACKARLVLMAESAKTEIGGTA